MAARNVDPGTVEGFGAEWSRFDQTTVPEEELRATFEQYFSLWPGGALAPDAVGFDAGCGSGRWARFVAPRVGTLHCVDASDRALAVARRALAGAGNCRFHHASVDELPFPDASMDFGYSLGVLHHVPDPLAGLRSCVGKLKPGAPFLVYLYYAFDNRPRWFRALWRASDVARRAICRAPDPIRYAISQGVAAAVYWPLARGAALAERRGADVANLPLSAYRHRSFYSMRTDALDRLGTRLERRFSADEVRRLMEAAGLERIRLRDGEPYWCALGYRAGDGRPVADSSS